MNSTLPDPGANLTSPITGTIVRWRIMDGSGGPYRLRVLTPGSATAYTGGAASDPETPAGTGVETFITNLPIQAGQTIGLDNTNPSDGIGDSEFTGGANQSELLRWRSVKPEPAQAAPVTSCPSTPMSNIPRRLRPLPRAVHRPPSRNALSKLKGRSLKADRKRLVTVGCRLGKVMGRKSASAKVTKQSPKPGSLLPLGTKVNVKLSG